MKHLFLWSTWVALLILPFDLVNGVTVPNGFSDSFVSGIQSATAMAVAPDGRIFVCEQTGSLRVMKSGALLSTPFTTIGVDSRGERGLLGVALDPNFAINHFIYVYYTALTPTPHNRISRFTANGDVAFTGSESVLFDLDPLSAATIHNGGAIHFGNDGNLYVAVGDNATGTNAQSMNILFGKILRIRPDGTIPGDNPFFNQNTGIYRAIWGLGLRNPFTFSPQPGTGLIFINDVGQDTWEEINLGIAGSNYGWPTTEGITTNALFRSPLHVYGHGADTSTGCAITGGTFYNPTVVQFPTSYTGQYFFADYCGGWIRYLNPASPGTSTLFATDLPSPVDLAAGPDGSLYCLTIGDGAVHKIQFNPAGAPTIQQQPTPQTVPEGQTATFQVSASGALPLTYQWQRNTITISGATNAIYTTPATTLADDGSIFRVIVSNGQGSTPSSNAVLRVASNAPTVTITAPATNALYSGGDTIFASGTATDPQDGSLPASAFTWRVDFQHDTHSHPFILPITGITGGSFTIPRDGETSDNVWYRIIATVRDSSGLTHATYRDLLPRKATMTFGTTPIPLPLTLDGQPLNAPTNITGVSGIYRNVNAPLTQAVNGVAYTFRSWSDGGTAAHRITTPPTNTTFTAFYDAVTQIPTSIQISTPSNGAVVSGVVTLTGTASNVPLNTPVEAQVDSSVFRQTAGVATWSISLNTRLLSNGNHIVRARVRDANGVYQFATITVTVLN